jgi:3-mercaptopyruvate sulfurtransferase SseA
VSRGIRGYIPLTSACELLELKRKGVTYAQLAEKLGAMGISETERNLNTKISRGGFSAAFLLQCLEAIGSNDIRLF